MSHHSYCFPRDVVEYLRIKSQPAVNIVEDIAHLEESIRGHFNGKNEISSGGYYDDDVISIVLGLFVLTPHTQSSAESDDHSIRRQEYQRDLLSAEKEFESLEKEYRALSLHHTVGSEEANSAIAKLRLKLHELRINIKEIKPVTSTDSKTAKEEIFLSYAEASETSRFYQADSVEILEHYNIKVRIRNRFRTWGAFVSYTSLL